MRRFHRARFGPGSGTVLDGATMRVAGRDASESVGAARGEDEGSGAADCGRAISNRSTEASGIHAVRPEASVGERYMVTAGLFRATIFPSSSLFLFFHEHAFEL